MRRAECRCLFYVKTLPQINPPTFRSLNRCTRSPPSYLCHSALSLPPTLDDKPNLRCPACGLQTCRVRPVRPCLRRRCYTSIVRQRLTGTGQKSAWCSVQLVSPLQEWLLSSDKLETERMQEVCFSLGESLCSLIVLCEYRSSTPCHQVLMEQQASHGQRMLSPDQLPLAMLTRPDPLHHRSYPHNRPPENLRVLCAEAKVERDCSVHCRYSLDSTQVAFDWFFGGTLWNLRSIRRLLCNHRIICRQHTSDRALPSDGSQKDTDWEEERGIACMIKYEGGMQNGGSGMYTVSTWIMFDSTTKAPHA